MSRPPHPDTPSRLVLDFSQPMRPKARVRVKIIPASETSLAGGIPARTKLYESLAKAPADE